MYSEHKGEKVLIDNLIQYDHQHLFRINDSSELFFYFLDHDERSYNINMDFQHCHSFYELCIFLDQSAVHIIQGELFDIECGDIVLLKPLLLHKTQYPTGAPSKRIIINFLFPLNILGVEESYQHLFNLFDETIPIYRFKGIEKRNIFNRLNQFLEATKQTTPLQNLLVHHLFVDFLSQIYLLKKQNIYEKKPSTDSLSKKIYDITSYIHANYSDSLSLKFLSKQFFISEYYLSRQFKKTTGFSVTDYIQHTRIKMVENLLSTTSMSISDIALSCGFNSFSQFNRVFNKFKNISPTKYRKSIHKLEGKNIISTH
jgi:AraC-like DNA-binding protein